MKTKTPSLALSLLSAQFLTCLLLLVLATSCGENKAPTSTSSPTTTTASTTTEPAKVEISTTDSAKTIDLPDGSKVSLNRGSSLSYSSNFEEANEKTVNLKGEAYFEVKKNTSKKFKVYAGNTKTTVVGTSFNLSAYEKDETVVLDVVEGEVLFSELDATTETNPVKANEQAIYQKNNHSIAKAKSKNKKFQWWMKDVMNDLNKGIKDINKDLKKVFKNK